MAEIREKGFVRDRSGLGRRKDGSTLWVLLNAQPWFDEQGRPAGMEGVARDITARMDAEAALRESEERFLAMFDLAPVGIAQADPATGRLLVVNPKLCLITGYPADELLTMRVSEITHPEDRERDWELFQSVVKGEAPEYWMEKRFVRKDNSVAWVNVNMIVLRDDAGAPVRTVGIIEDITERKRAEEASARFLAGSPAVIYALRLAPGGFRASWFSENIHSLTGYTYAEVRAGNPQRWWEQGIHADNLQRVVAANQAVLDEGHAMVEFRFRRLIGEDRELLTDLAADPSWVKVDPGQLEQVVMNLAMNARDAMPRGGRLTIRTRTLDPGEPVDLEETASRRRGGSGASLRAVPRGTETVLVVEDEDAVRRIVKIALESAGYRVIEARNGPEALEAVRTHSGEIQLVVTDVVMPKMSGRELVERIVKDHPGVRILYMSGYTDDAVVRHGIVESGVAFLQKPFTPLALARKVREVLDGKAPEN